jgi:oryzin
MVNVRRLASTLTALLPLVSAAPTQVQQKREVIPGKYIVTLKDSASAADVESHLSWVQSVHARSLAKRQTAGVEKTYNINSWNAYAGEFDDDTLEEIKASADVSSS